MTDLVLGRLGSLKNISNQNMNARNIYLHFCNFARESALFLNFFFFFAVFKCLIFVIKCNYFDCRLQWCNNSWGGRGCPPTLLTGKFLLTYREKRGKEKRENGEEKKENQKREGGKVTKWGEDHFFFHFSKPPKFVWGLPKQEFSTGEKIRKNYFAPSEKYSSYTSGRLVLNIVSGFRPRVCNLFGQSANLKCL